MPMREIKTVICPIERHKEFDNTINKLLLCRWELKKRTTLSAQGEPSEAGRYAVIQGLYAELERERFPEEVTV